MSCFYSVLWSMEPPILSQFFIHWELQVLTIYTNFSLPYNFRHGILYTPLHGVHSVFKWILNDWTVYNTTVTCTTLFNLVRYISCFFSDIGIGETGYEPIHWDRVSRIWHPVYVTVSDNLVVLLGSVPFITTSMV